MSRSNRAKPAVGTQDSAPSRLEVRAGCQPLLSELSIGKSSWHVDAVDFEVARNLPIRHIHLAKIYSDLAGLTRLSAQRTTTIHNIMGRKRRHGGSICAQQLNRGPKEFSVIRRNFGARQGCLSGGWDQNCTQKNRSAKTIFEGWSTRIRRLPNGVKPCPTPMPI